MRHPLGWPERLLTPLFPTGKWIVWACLGAAGTCLSRVKLVGDPAVWSSGTRIWGPEYGAETDLQHCAL
ncbi:hypothetical protein I79_005110 [Cricetulus griseus]|uniref:Uncharacterized protein n=1 Tax=Cricetulus griseus TaxID=10029 RepID=G3H4B0_CRIGR|nr:hypothetical protein I79_005110 [Cricetulus griseus]